MKGNLLIVDDEPLILSSMQFNLEEFADQVFTASNGIEALDILEKNSVQCVICDINMPKMNGVEVIKKMREKDNNIPFIFYTGHGNNDLMLEAAKYGAFDFLNKPNLEGLEEVVIQGLKQGTKVSSTDKDQETSFKSEYSKILSEIDKKFR